MTGIIILNWNGYEDTIECLQSLLKCTGEEFFIVLVDNGSDNDSVNQLKAYLKDSEYKDVRYVSQEQFENGEMQGASVQNHTCILYTLRENYGFAKGNNIGLKLAKQLSPEYYMLLNNDTEVEPDFLTKLVEFIRIHPKYSVLTPKISFYFNKDLIWNCGGRLFWGFRKYYYAGKPETSIKKKSHINIGYVTGCALFFKAEIIKDAPLLTERFFHGEEDFEFSYRMRRNGVKIACVLASHIYHKVSIATKNFPKLGGTYNYYLQRSIDMRLNLSKISYFFWLKVNLFYFGILLKRHGYDMQTIKRLRTLLKKEVYQKDGVSKERFFELLTDGI